MPADANESRGLFLDFDSAWDRAAAESVGIQSILDLRAWGPRLRYHARRRDVGALSDLLEAYPQKYLLYGSGDFHHLAGLFLRRAAAPATTLVSFDNHPDWDIRPPAWACGGWINRALELPDVRSAQVWGCGNFELRWPSRWFANRRALRAGRLAIHAWAERQPPAVGRRFNCMTRENWRERFQRFADSVAGENLYITVDLDALAADQSVTNWENGLFTAADVAWAIRLLRERSIIVGGDLCGAASEQRYSRVLQRLAAQWDHPPQRTVAPAAARAIQSAALAAIWPALAGQTAII